MQQEQFLVHCTCIYATLFSLYVRIKIEWTTSSLQLACNNTMFDQVHFFMRYGWLQKRLLEICMRYMHAKWNKDSLGYIHVIICTNGLMIYYVDHDQTRLQVYIMGHVSIYSSKWQCGHTHSTHDDETSYMCFLK